MRLQPGPVPLYYQLREILERRILSGAFQPGDQFATDENLCQEFDLSRGTVRRAIDMLVEEGLLRREQGRGTFVSPATLSPVYFRLADFAEDMRQRGLEPSTLLLQLRVLPATEEMASRLEISPGDAVIEIARLRLADGRPMAYETRYLAQALCPDFVHEELERQSVHSLLIDKYGIPLIRACHTIEARSLSTQEAELLQVEPGTAGFAVDRVTYTVDNRPVTWYRTVYRGDEYRFTAEFQRSLAP